MISPFGSPETTYLGSGFVILGYLLAVHGWTFLVAGYDDSEIPAEVVTDMVGRFALLVGLATIGFGAALRGAGSAFDRYAPVFALVVLLAALGLTYRLNTYDRTSTNQIDSQPFPGTSD